MELLPSEMRGFDKIANFINYFYLSIDVDEYSQDYQKVISPSSFTRRVFNVFRYLVYAIVKLPIGVFKDQRLFKVDRAIFVISLNNYNATKFLCNADERYINIIPFGNRIKKKIYPRLEICFTFDLIHKLRNILNLYRYVKNDPARIRLFDLLFKNVGLYEESLRYLKKIEPSFVVFSNDHSPQSRAMLLACLNLKIKTVYIQHASINKNSPFPPLSFDLSFLEGLHAKELYQRQGSKGKIVLTGMPKFDDYAQFRKEKTDTINTIGLAYSDNDELSIVSRVAKSLMDKFKEKTIIIRPHPADERDLQLKKLVKSDSKQENSFDFIRKIDLLIASDSSIHLESCLLNVQSIYYRLNTNSSYDSYGYIENKVCFLADNLEEIANFIDNYKFDPFYFHNAKYYVDNPDPIVSGKSHLLVMNKINQFCS